MLRSALFDIFSFSQRQIAFLGPLEWKNLFGQKSKVVIYQKLIKRSGIRFLILFVLMDAILLRQGLRKRPKVKKSFKANFVFTRVNTSRKAHSQLCTNS